MCLLCSGKPLHESLRSLYCSYCPFLKSLPEKLPEGLQSLYCYNCPLLKTLPEKLPEGLQTLDCSNCPLLTSLPEILHESLKELDCFNCPKLASIPKNLPENPYLWGCPWLPQNSKEYPKQIPKLLIVQRAVRDRRLRKFVKLTSSRAFNEYFFHPERKGGLWSKRQLEKQFDPKRVL